MPSHAEQLTLAPVARNSPVESVEAARKVNAARQLELVLAALYGADRPLTDDEIADACGLLRHSAGTRRGVAQRMGLVRRVGRSVTPRGNACATWALTEAGRQYVRGVA